MNQRPRPLTFMVARSRLYGAVVVGVVAYLAMAFVPGLNAVVATALQPALA
jgi:hypothetical protein